MFSGCYSCLAPKQHDAQATKTERLPFVAFRTVLLPQPQSDPKRQNLPSLPNSPIFLEKQPKTAALTAASPPLYPTPKNILSFDYSVSIYRAPRKQFDMINALQSIQISQQKVPTRKMYFPQISIGSAVQVPLLYFVYPQSVVCYVQQNGWAIGGDAEDMGARVAQAGAQEIRIGEDLSKSSSMLKEKAETCESSNFFESSLKTHKKWERQLPLSSIPSQPLKSREVKLRYRIEWKNENRNIVPNLINQMISYLLKPSKSSRLVQRLFSILPRPSICSVARYFQYVKKIRESVTHYVNESVFLQFLEIHQPNCQLYPLEEQQFYMKVCRIVNLSFLRNEITLISLTSKRMSQAKRRIHLIARDALAEKFVELCQELSQ